MENVRVETKDATKIYECMDMTEKKVTKSYGS